MRITLLIIHIPVFLNVSKWTISHLHQNWQQFIQHQEHTIKGLISRIFEIKYIHVLCGSFFSSYLALTIFQIQCQIYRYISWHNQLHWQNPSTIRKKKERDSAKFSFAGNQSIVNWNFIDFPEWYGLTGCYTLQ